MWSLNTLDLKKNTSPELEKIRAIVSAVGDKVYNEGLRLENEYKMYINQIVNVLIKKMIKIKIRNKKMILVKLNSIMQIKLF